MALVTLALLAGLHGTAMAEDSLFNIRQMTPEVALKAAQAALSDCRGRGFQVSVAVVDRQGVLQVLLRDRFAGTQLEVQVQLGVILYPPGSEPSPEPHGHGPAYERHLAAVTGQAPDEGESMEPLPEMEPEPGSDQPTTEIVK